MEWNLTLFTGSSAGWGYRGTEVTCWNQGRFHFSVQRGVHEADQIDQKNVGVHNPGQPKKVFRREYISGYGDPE
jgi:hypothetical protein